MRFIDREDPAECAQRPLHSDKLMQIYTHFVILILAIQRGEVRYAYLLPNLSFTWSLKYRKILFIKNSSTLLSFIQTFPMIVFLENKNTSRFTHSMCSLGIQETK